MEFIGGSTSLYGVLGVRSFSSDEEIRRAYLKLAMQWHPDRWTRNPSRVGEAKKRFQKIQEAYSVLSDRRKRRRYDAGLYGTDIEEDDEVECVDKINTNLRMKCNKRCSKCAGSDLELLHFEPQDFLIFSKK